MCKSRHGGRESGLLSTAKRRPNASKARWKGFQKPVTMRSSQQSDDPDGGTKHFEAPWQILETWGMSRNIFREKGKFIGV